MSDLPKHYDPKAVEARLYSLWEASGVFHEEPDPARPPFIVCMPPPNVTGRAHLGHGSTFTPMDVLVRYHRMRGDNADWLPGTDHAAIATEAVLVRELSKEGRSRESLGREAYLARAWEWSRQYGGTIEAQFRALGFGPDWDRKRFTMDDGLSAAVRRAFVLLYRDGLIYRGKRLVNWDPKARTTISDAEVEHEERDGFLWRIRYPFRESRDGIDVATTRPETMLADVAIAVHPDDPRYAGLIGKRVLVPPMLEREIPILADPSVDRDFGTGAVKVTPAHDATDYETGIRHGLAMPSVIDTDARITGDDIPVGRYARMDRYEARDAILRDLREAELLIAEEPYRHAVAVSERTGEVIEPLLSLQWFVGMKSLAAAALDAFRKGSPRFVPERYGRMYEHWLQNIRDWNISRQIWWGHRLPVWYTEAGDVVVAETEEEARAVGRAQFHSERLSQDPDTLDTWFSSALWPFSILGWPQETPEFRHWYPSQVLVTGPDILFLWVSRMVMLGLKFAGRVPFADVFLTPTVYDAQGRKMSKSVGNTIDPMELAGTYGADAFRLGMLRQMRIESQEIRFHESRCEEARNFNNKIWNAARYVLALPEGLPAALSLPSRGSMTLADRWILARLHDAALGMERAFAAYDFGAAEETARRFLWYEFCDWYLEATKDPYARETRAAVASFVLNNALRLLHPLAPFVSEEIWLAIPHDGATILTASWPDAAEIPVDAEAARRFESLRGIVENIRTLRADLGLQPRDRIALDVPAGVVEAEASLVATLAGGVVERVPGEGLEGIRARAPRTVLSQRYKKEAARLRAEVERGERKLSDERFVSKANPAVVAKEREKLDGYRAEYARAVAAVKELEEAQ